MVWPFDEKKSNVPRLGQPMHQPFEPTDVQRIAALEQKCAQLEWAIHEICTAIQITQDQSNHNFAAMSMSFQKLVAYVMRPAKHIMGEQQDVN